MNLWLLLIIGGIVNWRISSIIINENMPFYLLDYLREKVGIVSLERLDEDAKSIYVLNNPDAKFYANDTLAISDLDWRNELFSCIGCMSVYIGTIISFVLLIGGLINFTLFLLFPFALSAIAIFIEIIRNKLLM